MPPAAGPATPPNRNPAWNTAEARPRRGASTTRKSSAIADTVNIDEPIPPIPRSTSSCTKDWDKPARALETATMIKPEASTRRSPSRSVNQPAKGEEMKRISAKADTTDDAARALTSKLEAKIGIAGMTIPKPSATKKAMVARIQTSRGSDSWEERPRNRTASL